MAGNADGAARAIDRAWGALDQQGRPLDPHWSGWIDATELDIMTGRVWAVLKDPAKAVPPLERALATYSDQWARDKALYLLYLADAYIEQREADQALSVALRAVELAGSVASVRPKARAEQVALRLGTLSGVDSGRLVEALRTFSPPIAAVL